MEINNSFYRLPTIEMFSAWREQTPPDFVFSVKADRYLTHIKKLKDPVSPWKNFYTNASALNGKLGPILFQFPPNWQVNVERLSAFLAIIPVGLKTAFEFRHASWFNRAVYDLLIQHGAALCQADSPDWPNSELITAGYVFIRMHGGRELYTSRYTVRELANLASRVKIYLDRGLSVYVYFNNDAQGHAVTNALELRRLLGG